MLLPLQSMIRKSFPCGFSSPRALLALGFAFFPATALQADSTAHADYEYYCYQCHGYAGDARTAASRSLSPGPRDFTKTPKAQLSRKRMIEAVRKGKRGTAMVSFARVLSARRIEAVVDYIRAELMGNAEKSARDLRYHTEANGWPHHDRYRPAYAFVQGMLPSDSPWESLSTEQRVGKRVFLSACLTCHDGHIRGENPMIWEPHAVSFPRSVDSCLDCHVSRPAELLPPSRAGILTPTPALVADSPYPIHGDARLLTASGAAAEKGQGVFLAHCAFCHAADGSSRNWIGSFLLPRPRDLSGRLPLYAEGTARLRAVIRDGIPGTSMPGWRSVLTGSQIENLIAYLTRTPDSKTGLSWQPGRPHETSPPQWIRTSRVNSGRIKNP